MILAEAGADWRETIPPMVEIVPATEEHALEMAQWLRPEDAASGRDPVEAVSLCMEASRAAWAAVEGGRVICLWGVCCPSLLGSTAELWLLGSRRLEDYPLQFLRHAREFVAEMQQQYPRLEINVHVKYRRALRFARWLGFDRRGEFTIDGHKFASFAWERREV